VLDEAGRPVAGLCVAAPRYRMTRAWIARIAPAVLATAREIADAFGRQTSAARTASAS
jgi:DNA-binding IclR family transcriptional regulator